MTLLHSLVHFVSHDIHIGDNFCFFIWVVAVTEPETTNTLCVDAFG